MLEGEVGGLLSNSLLLRWLRHFPLEVKEYYLSGCLGH